MPYDEFNVAVMYQTGFDLTLAMYKKTMREAEIRRKDKTGRMLDYYNNGQLEHVLEDNGVAIRPTTSSILFP